MDYSSSQMNFMDHVPMKQYEAETEVRASGVSLSKIDKVTQKSDDMPNIVGEEVLNQMKVSWSLRPLHNKPNH